MKCPFCKHPDTQVVDSRESTLDLGDPYHCHCRKTARLLGDAMEIAVDVAFQSRFGSAKWLEPATDAVLNAYPGQGITKLAIAAPGFSADCLETIEELGIRGRADFLAAGGKHFARLDCLNDGEAGMTMLDAPHPPRTCRMVAIVLTRPQQ